MVLCITKMLKFKIFIKIILDNRKLIVVLQSNNNINMKLELKHLAPYLPYNIHLLQSVKGGGACYGKNINRKRILNIKNVDSVLNSSITKPILRPLSDLTKEISNGVGLFYPYEEMKLCYSDVNDFLNKDLWIGQWLDYEKVNKLFEWHFDVFGLIPQGLAVDINTL